MDDRIKKYQENIDNIETSPICNTCKHKLEGISCQAFAIIPDDILFENGKHNTVRPNQIGKFIYEKKK